MLEVVVRPSERGRNRDFGAFGGREYGSLFSLDDHGHGIATAQAERR